MSIEAINWAFNQPITPMARKFVLVVLANYADEDYSCYPSQQKIADRIGASVETVRRAIKELEASGLIRREKRYRDDGYRSTDRYFLAVKMPTGQFDHQSNEGTLPVNQSDLTGQIAGAEPSVNHQEPKGSPDRSRSRASKLDPNEFLDWYLEYPRKEARAKAEQAYFKARAKVSADVLMDGVKRYAADPNRERQFTKLPATWLNGGCWDDDPLPEKSNGARPAAARPSIWGDVMSGG